MSPVDHSDASGYILYVEDNRELSVATAEMLQMNGYRVKIASTGAEALELMAEGAPELVIVDLHLPGKMGGLELYRELKKRSSGKKLPFIITTGFAGRDSFVSAHELGAKAYFTKPLDSEQLLRKIREILHR